MPFYELGEHKIDHPPLFACRAHKQFLKLTAGFVKEILNLSQDVVPGNLSEVAAPFIGGDANAFKLPEYLIPPRVVLYNPDGLRGASALPFTLVFIDKKFVGIPAAYLTRERFDGCTECGAPPASSRPASGVRQAPPLPTGKLAPATVGLQPGSGVRPSPAPARKPGAPA